MVALVTLSESSKGKLVHLLNNLNLGIAAADFGTHFVNLLTDGSTDTNITDRQEAQIGHLLNNLNLGTAKLGFGDLMQDFLHSKAKREAAAQALTLRQRNQLRLVLNDLNLGLAEIGFGDIVDQTIAAVIAGANAGPALSFTTDLPATKTAAAGADATFSVVATGGKTPYTYKWYWKGSTGSFVLIDPNADPQNPNPSAATATLVNHAVSAASAGSYKVEVTDADGTKITSAVCVLTVS